MSIIILATFFALTVAQLVFWEALGEAFGHAASVSIMGLCASITLILAAYVAATHTFRLGKARRPNFDEPEVHDRWQDNGCFPAAATAHDPNNDFAEQRLTTGGQSCRGANIVPSAISVSAVCQGPRPGAPGVPTGTTNRPNPTPHDVRTTSSRGGR
jgi:hypothetical protein